MRSDLLPEIIPATSVEGGDYALRKPLEAFLIAQLSSLSCSKPPIHIFLAANDSFTEVRNTRWLEAFLTAEILQLL